MKLAYAYIYIYSSPLIIRKQRGAEINNGEIKDSLAEREKRVPARNTALAPF